MTIFFNRSLSLGLQPCLFETNYRMNWYLKQSNDAAVIEYFLFSFNDEASISNILITVLNPFFPCSIKRIRDDIYCLGIFLYCSLTNGFKTFVQIKNTTSEIPSESSSWIRARRWQKSDTVAKVPNRVNDRFN
ncbi:hypothetical protein BpHYR1_033661 [Brachionus plicatilis]|uniref:Uncharacterized protein n=1 Tax=Brachionus plicatilis TaxID=10195 RepID=A0A3M7RHM6_BRAPC|nr:hypothetical protein BpHYR1_033661 [Brachionus plicatilis]